VQLQLQLTVLHSKVNCLRMTAASFTQTCGLSYWTQQQTKFPLMAHVAQDLLSAPASQAYVERVFSVCGDLTAGKRNRMSKTLAMLAFLKVNQKYYAYCGFWLV